MKKLIISFVFLFFFLSFWYLYEVNYEDKLIIDQIQISVDKKFSNEPVYKLINFYNDLKYKVKKADHINQRSKTILNEVLDNISDYVNDREDLLNFKKEFWNKYWKEIISKHKIPDRCLSKNKLIYKIAKKENIPPALIIAAWYMETSCKTYNPKNWDWVFQIVSSYYPPSDNITDIQFEQQIMDFINFSRNKWSWYEKHKSSFSKFQRFDWITINLAFDNWDIESIRAHAILYNWLYDFALPMTSLYTNWNLTPNHEYIKDWFFTVFLKFLEWEINNWI